MKCLVILGLIAGLLCLGPAPGQAQTDRAAVAARISALDRAVSARPDDPQLRVDLGLALLQAGVRDRAQYHLLQARAAPLSQASRRELDTLLNSLGRQQDREGWFSLAIVPETNPVQRTEIDTIWIGGLPFRLNPNAQAQRATGLHVMAGGAIMPRLTEAVRLRLGASFSARLYEEQALQDIILRGDIGFQGQTLAGQNWSVNASVAHRTVGGKSFGRGLGLHLRWAQRFGRASVLRLHTETVNWRFGGAAGLDGPRMSASVEVRHALRPDLVLTGTAALSRVNARAAHEAGRSLRVSFAVERSFAGGLVMIGETFAQRHRRDGADPVLGILRRDTTTGVGLRALHRNISFGNFSPVIEASFTRQRSNNALHTWRNTRVSVGLTRTF